MIAKESKNVQTFQLSSHHCHEGERQDKPKESVRGVNEEGKDEAESRI